MQGRTNTAEVIWTDAVKGSTKMQTVAIFFTSLQEDRLMTAITFDTLAYSKELMKLGLPQEQAEGFARLTKEKDDADKKAFEAFKADVQKQIDEKNEVLRKELATKLDLADIRLEIEKVRREVEQLRSETNSKIDQTKSDLVRWQIGIGLTGFGILGGIMAKGFGWLGF